MARNNAKGKYQVDTNTNTFSHLEAESSQNEWNSHTVSQNEWHSHTVSQNEWHSHTVSQNEWHSHTVSQTALQYVSVYMTGFGLCTRLLFFCQAFLPSLRRGWVCRCHKTAFSRIFVVF